MKELMDKAQAAYAKGKYVEAEAYAKRAQEIDPNEVAATSSPSRPRPSGATRPTSRTKTAKEEGVVDGLPGGRHGRRSPTPRSSSTGSSSPKNFKDLTRERLRMNARLEPKKDPKTLAIEAKLNEPVSLNIDKQPLSEAIDFLQNYTGLNIVLDPKAPDDEGLTSALAGQPDGQQHPAQDGPEADAQAARPDLQGRGRGAPDHQPAGVDRHDVSRRPTTSAT